MCDRGSIHLLARPAIVTSASSLLTCARRILTFKVIHGELHTTQPGLQILLLPMNCYASQNPSRSH